ncbi:uncharacterized protein LY89DRAFT_732670 [Mollisia scopiformis]|uniref:Uncharacterized protein n=1 Tax=Mollisia scopiformis TaxID=149040 RepID=A0A194XDZ1_MOLSC|nr:uncharacterized protein LY89DRAFT_732670 [Mollisia scopiformis]KUJ17967.1 hypothetical protein LY89DRAFT_732670 [Mollisia scopiformis]
MPDSSATSRMQSSHIRQRLPRRAKANNSPSIDDATVTGPELTERSVNILKHRESMAESNLSRRDVKQFEFVTLTSQPTMITTRQTSKTVRKQAMNDYLRKQNRQATTGIVETVESVQLEEPSRYKGKFKLDTWSHKTKTKAILARRTKLSHDESPSANEESLPTIGSWAPSSLARVTAWQPIERDDLLPRIFSPSTSSIDPFDTLAIRLGPLSENLLVHYNTEYTMNSVAINAESNFFSFVKTDPALFHSILYLVSLHRDIWYGLVDSPISLYHGSEAFRIINERLENNFIFDDVTIAAVAMLNLNGRYDLSKMHMQGLKQMIQTRGGPPSLSGVFRRIVTWSDFCFANVWNIQPSFPRLPSTPPNSPTSSPSLRILESDPDLYILKPSHLFGSSSPIIQIINNFRTLTRLLPPSQTPSLPKSVRMHASNLIYDTEYSLLALNPPSSTPDSFSLALSNCGFVFESLPLRTALHLYLYLSIRLIPTSSELVQSMLLRLKDSLEQLGIVEWWESDEERRIWLLWIFWVGAVAAKSEERWWFVSQVGRLCAEMNIWDVKRLKETLRRAVWEEEWCGNLAERVWDDFITQTAEVQTYAE